MLRQRATWTRNHGHSYYGYKVGINVDKRYKIICRVGTATAATSDSHQFEADLDADPLNNTSRAVYADRGYPSEARELHLKAKGLSNHIQRRGCAIDHSQDVRNDAIIGSQKRAPELSMSVLPWLRWAAP